VILSHAESLAWLVDGTPAHAQCVKLIARDIEDKAMTTPEDAQRIVASYTDAEKIAVMHVCGACGVRDPAKSYCRTASLPNLPANDWLRAKSAFVAQIGALGSVTLLARTDPPLPQRPVHVPPAMMFNLDEVNGQYFHVVCGALLPDDASLNH
jgi:hypothetical protein